MDAQISLMNLVERFPESRYAGVSLWEAALLAEQRGVDSAYREAMAILEREQGQPDKELLALALMFFVGGFAAWIVGFAPLRLAAALAAALAAVGGLVAWVRAKKAVDEYVGPWSAPDPEWRVHEARRQLRATMAQAAESPSKVPTAARKRKSSGRHRKAAPAVDIDLRQLLTVS